MLTLDRAAQQDEALEGEAPEGERSIVRDAAAADGALLRELLELHASDVFEPAAHGAEPSAGARPRSAQRVQRGLLSSAPEQPPRQALSSSQPPGRPLP